MHAITSVVYGRMRKMRPFRVNNGRLLYARKLSIIMDTRTQDNYHNPRCACVLRESLSQTHTYIHIHTFSPLCNLTEKSFFLTQGDIIAITKKIDDNWFQGYLGDQKGIFPSSYVEILEGTVISKIPQLYHQKCFSFKIHSHPVTHVQYQVQ